MENNKHADQKSKYVKSKELNKELRKNKKGKHPRIKKVIKVILLLLLLLIIIGIGIFAGIFFSDKWVITKEDLTLSNINTTIYDKDGNEIASVAGDEKRKIVSISDMPQNLKDAFVSIEDERFYSHHGIDLKRTLGATVTYVFHKGSSSYGGSTITQQLVKNLMNDTDDNGVEGIQRKIREMSRAYQVEKMLSKDQILELYLNIIFMGGDVYGVELGSEYYFNKPVKDLDLAQCAFLAGINHSPNSYNPYGGTDNSSIIKKRTETVLAKMKQLGKISEDDYTSAVAEVESGLNFEKGSTTATSTMSYLAKAALNQAIDQYADEKQVDTDYATTKIYGGGYKIYTTQDSSIQSTMENVYTDDTYILKSKQTDGAHSQSAMVVIDQKTGNVVGCVGGLGTDVNSNGLNRATQSVRQPGSSIKPLASIAPALESGIITAATVYNESKSYFGDYNPTSSNLGLITVRKAIKVSANTTEVKIMSELGPSNSIAFMKKMGITSLVTSSDNSSQNDENLAMVLGGLTEGVSPLEMAGAYAAIANDGVYISPTFFTKVEDNYGNIVLQPNQTTTRVMSEGNAYIEKSILTGPVESGGTAPYCKISGQDTGGKTGTTTENKDRWFCGFTNYYTAATWFGYDTPEYINSSTNPAARLWASVMKKVHANLADSTFEKPSNIVSAQICLDSGKVATSSCPNTYTEYFVKGTVPDDCDGHKTLKICTDTGKIANEYCPNVEEKSYTKLPEKEDTTLWKTPSNGNYSVPTETCTEHTAENTKKTVKMINVVGLTQSDATNKIKALGLNVDVKTDNSSSVAKGNVISQSKSEGVELNLGETVTITISDGVKDTNKNTTTNTDTTGGNSPGNTTPTP